MAAVLVVAIVLQVPAVVNLKGFIVTGQDYNPVHWGELYLHGDMPATDDSEVGENAKSMVFSSMYTWLPLTLNVFGVPLESIVFVHALLGLPLLLSAVYALSFSLFGNASAAALAALLFPFGQFALFAANVGYPLLFGRAFYYGDFNHVFVAASLVAMVRRQHSFAAASLAILTLLNPTYGLNVILVWCLWLALSGEWKLLVTTRFGPLAVVALALTAAYVQTRLAMPAIAPAPVEARRFAIETYGHINPHIFDVRSYAFAQLTLFSLLVCSCVREYRASWSQAQAHGFSVATAVTGVYVLFGIVTYPVIYAWQPTLFILLSPGKITMVAALWTTVFVGMGLYELLTDGRWHRVAALSAVLVVGWWVGASSAPQNGALWATAVGLGAAGVFTARGPVQPTSSPWPSLVVFAGCALLLLQLGRQHAWIRDPSFFDQPNAFIDIQDQLRRSSSPTTRVLPFRLPGSANRYGMFTNFPFRTYSRRGAVGWVVGRNAYFNSRERHRQEELVFRAATGGPLWEPMLLKAARQRRESPWHYYFGVGGTEARFLGPAGAWSIYTSEIGRMTAAVDKMDLSAFREFAARAGATHVLICKDPGQPAPVGVELQNDHFALLPVKPIPTS